MVVISISIYFELVIKILALLYKGKGSKMGNDESVSKRAQNVSVSPVIKQLRQTLKLKATLNKTSAFIGKGFAQSIKKTSGQISRINNPYCPILIDSTKNQTDEQWLMCGLISPIMAIASPRGFCDEKSVYKKNAKVAIMTKNLGLIEIKVKDVFVIMENVICVLLLQFPILEAGWSGLTFLEDEEQVSEQPYRIISHPRSYLDEKTQKQIHQQQIQKVFYKHEADFIGNYKAVPGTLVFKLVDKKPYIVGVQINERQAHFITNEIFQRVTRLASKYMDSKRQRQILEKIDIQAFQIMQIT